MVPVAHTQADVLQGQVVDEPARPDRAVGIGPDSEPEVDRGGVVYSCEIVQLEHRMLPTAVGSLGPNGESVGAVGSLVGAGGDGRVWRDCVVVARHWLKPGPRAVVKLVFDPDSVHVTVGAARCVDMVPVVELEGEVGNRARQRHRAPLQPSVAAGRHASIGVGANRQGSLGGGGRNRTVGDRVSPVGCRGARIVQVGGGPDCSGATTCDSSRQLVGGGVVEVLDISEGAVRVE